MASAPLQPTVYSGTFISCTSLGEIEVLENALVGVDGDGKISFKETKDVMKGKTMEDVIDVWGWVKKRGEEGEEWDLVECGRGGRSWFFPGFVGTLELFLLNEK